MVERDGHIYYSIIELSGETGWSHAHVKRRLQELVAPNEVVLTHNRKRYYHSSHMETLERERKSHVLRLEELAKTSETPKTPKVLVGASELRDLRVSITQLQKEIKELHVFEAQMKVVVKALASRVHVLEST